MGQKPTRLPSPSSEGICVEITGLLGHRALGQRHDFIARPMRALTIIQWSNGMSKAIFSA